MPPPRRVLGGYDYNVKERGIMLSSSVWHFYKRSNSSLRVSLPSIGHASNPNKKPPRETTKAMKILFLVINILFVFDKDKDIVTTIHNELYQFRSVSKGLKIELKKTTK